jgi:hypothetical protein
MDGRGNPNGAGNSWMGATGTGWKMGIQMPAGCQPNAFHDAQHDRYE